MSHELWILVWGAVFLYGAYVGIGKINKDDVNTPRGGFFGDT